MSISRLYTFTPNTLARSSEVNAEFDQLVSEVNLMFKKDGSSPMTGDLEIEKSNPAVILDGQETSAAGFRIRSNGASIDFDRYISSVWTKMVGLSAGQFLVVDSAEEDIGIRITSSAPTADLRDVFLALRANNLAANEWKIVLDNSDSKILKFQYNGVTEFQLSTTGLFTPTLGVVAPYFEPTADDASAPVANRLYQANVPKAWASLSCSSGGATVVDDHNVSSVSLSSNYMTISIDTDFANSTYAISALPLLDYVDNVVVAFGTRSVGSFTIVKMNAADGIAVNWQDGDILLVSVIGDQ